MVNNNSNIKNCIRDLENRDHVIVLLTAYWAIGEEIKYIW